MTAALSGAGTLIRTREPGRVNLSFNSLEADTAYIICWMAFNALENCAEEIGKCGIVGIFSPEAETAFFYGECTTNNCVDNQAVSFPPVN